MSFQRSLKLRLNLFLSFRALLILGLVTTLTFFYFHPRSYPVGLTKKKWQIGFEIRSGDNDISEYNPCIHPTLNIDDPIMMRFYKKGPEIKCTKDENWVHMSNGKILFSEKAQAVHGAFHCDYFPLIRGPGDYNISFGNPVRDIKHLDPIVSDFSKIKCKGPNNTFYENIHAGVHRNDTIRERLKTTKPPANGLGLSIAFIGFDSMSRMSWLRRMPKTRDYMVNELKAIELESYNIVGDGTPAALFPILTGHHERELPDARRNYKGAKPVDDFPWLWRDFSKNGYVTSWADAQIGIAPFNYRLLGFEHSPTDYFMRPFYLAADPYYANYSANCHRSEPRHMVWFNFIREIFNAYKDDPKFMVHFYTPLSHDDNNMITVADEDLKDLITNLHSGGFLNNTLLAVMADHGARYDVFRRTKSGRLEERLPYVSLLFPPWFEAKYPHLVRNVRTNVHRLTTPFDLHETFKDFLKFDGAGIGDTRKRGISLFKEIPKSRSCADADVIFHWCACLDWKSVPISDPGAKRALQTALDSINNYTQPFRADCALLSVGNVTTLSKISTTKDALSLDMTTTRMGSSTDTPKKMDITIYQMTFFTEPGHGEFEITLEHLLDTDEMFVNPKSISRINMYGNAPACILHKNREVRQYCYCNNNTPVHVQKN